MDINQLITVIPTLVLSCVSLFVSWKALRASAGRADRPWFDSLETLPHENNSLPVCSAKSEGLYFQINLTNNGLKPARGLVCKVKRPLFRFFGWTQTRVQMDPYEAFIPVNGALNVVVRFARYIEDKGTSGWMHGVPPDEGFCWRFVLYYRDLYGNKYKQRLRITGVRPERLSS